MIAFIIFIGTMFSFDSLILTATAVICHLIKTVKIAPMLWSPFSFARAKRAREKGDHNMGAVKIKQDIKYSNKQGALDHTLSLEIFRWYSDQLLNCPCRFKSIWPQSC